MGKSSIPVALIAISASLFLFPIAGCGSSEAQGEIKSQAAIQQYRAYLERGAADLVTRIKAMVGQLEAGEASEAESTYATARVPYGHIKPVTRSFGKLNSHIDALPGEVPASKLEGFHRIEKGLWVEGTTAGLVPVAKRLLANLEKFQSKVKAIRLQPARVVRSATETLEELSASAIHNKEERYSEIDMLDVAAGVEGVEAAFKAAKPPIEAADPGLAANIEVKLDRAYARARHFGTPAHQPEQPHPEAPGTSFVLYYIRTPHEYQVMNEKIRALIKQLSQAPALLGEG